MFPGQESLPAAALPAAGKRARATSPVIVSTVPTGPGGAAGPCRAARIYSRPLHALGFLLAWQDEVVALAPVPAVVIANLGVRREWARLTNLAICSGAVVLTGAAGFFGLAAAAGGPARGLLGPLFLLVAAGLAAPVLLPGPRAGVARVLPFDPESPPALLALVAVLILVGFQANYQAGHDALATVGGATRLQPVDVLGEELPLLLLAVLGVGLFTRRDAGQVLARLGVVRPAPWQILTALAVAGLFLAASAGAQELQRQLDPSLADRLERATSHYYGGINGIAGIAVIALAPGIAEEAFFRGALQPRLGIWLSALAFAAVHTQYALTVDTLLVFVLGAGLGVIRRALNTTSSMTAHTAYNALAGIGLPAAALSWALPAEAALIVLAALAWWLSPVRRHGSKTP